MKQIDDMENKIYQKMMKDYAEKGVSDMIEDTKELPYIDIRDASFENDLFTDTSYHDEF